MERHFKKNYLGEEVEISFESVGESTKFKNIREKSIHEESQTILIEFYCSIALLAIIFAVILVEMKNEKC